MIDYITIGSVPFDEACAQVGSPDYAAKSREECSRFATALKALYPAADFRVKSFPHDFGTYREVVAYYDTEDPESEQAAYDAEACPYSTWEDLEAEASIAREEESSTNLLSRLV